LLGSTFALRFRTPDRGGAARRKGVAMNWFWHALWIAFVVIPVTLLWIFCLVDVFRRHDLSGWGKTGWVLAILIFPWLGAIVYLVTRPYADARQQPANAAVDVDAPASATGSTADELTKLEGLRSQGVLSEHEFAVQKAKLLGMPTPRAATGDQVTTSSTI
jgi:hypothetical protein